MHPSFKAKRYFYYPYFIALQINSGSSFKNGRLISVSIFDDRLVSCFIKNIGKYNCKVYNKSVILYLNDQEREIVCMIDPTHHSISFSHENAFFELFFPYQIQKYTKLIFKKI